MFDFVIEVLFSVIYALDLSHVHLHTLDLLHTLTHSFIHSLVVRLLTCLVTLSLMVPPIRRARSCKTTVIHKRQNKLLITKPKVILLLLVHSITTRHSISSLNILHLLILSLSLSHIIFLLSFKHNLDMCS